MPEAALIVSERQHHPMRELAETLRYELELQGISAMLHLGGFPGPAPERVWILVDPFGYLEAEGPLSLPAHEVLRRTIFVCAGRGLPVLTDGRLELLRRAGAVFATDQPSVVQLHRAGVPARLLRPGYSKALDRYDPQAHRPIDVFFLGAHSHRRTRYLARAARVLSRRNCLLQLSPSGQIAGPTPPDPGPGRWPILAQAKIVIDIHHGDDHRFAWQEALDAIHAGAVVVSEHSSGTAPLVCGQHLLMAAPDALPYVVDSLLRDEERLVRVRTEAYERLSSWIPFALPVSVLRAAIVELVGQPVAASAPLSGFGPPQPVVPEATADPAPPAVDEVEGLRRELADAHAAVAAAEQQLEALRRRPDAGRTEILHVNAAWRARCAVRASALLALPGGRRAISETLDALAASWSRDFELVVVDGGADAVARGAVRQWMLAHPRIPSLLVSSGARHGRGAALNVGADFARAPGCLILDPGQQLYPPCLHVLLDTLVAAPEMSFAYPIQEVIGRPESFVEAGGDYLLSYLAWDPRRLRRRNEIQAPYLIRTALLRAAGGFATDPRLEGFEDYDLWCRLSERGWRGQLVSQILARRTESRSSSTLRTLHPAPGPATEALAERSPELLAGAFTAS